MSTAPKGALDTTPYWAASQSSPGFGPLDHDEHADVVVVGGGITGLTDGLPAGHGGQARGRARARGSWARSTPATPPRT